MKRWFITIQANGNYAQIEVTRELLESTDMTKLLAIIEQRAEWVMYPIAHIDELGD